MKCLRQSPASANYKGQGSYETIPSLSLTVGSSVPALSPFITQPVTSRGNSSFNNFQEICEKQQKKNGPCLISNRIVLLDQSIQ